MERERGRTCERLLCSALLQFISAVHPAWRLGTGAAVLALFFFTALSLPAAEPFLQKTNLFTEETGGFRLYRIPGIVVTAKGSVLAYCEARKFTVADRGEIEIHLRRSADGGRTWSPAKQVAHLGPRLPRNPHMPEAKKKKDMGGPTEQTVNNPVAIAARDGTVHLLYCVEYVRAFHIRSDDDGVTWSAPVEITSTFERFRPELDWQVIATGPGHAVQLRNGRLVAPFWMATYEKQPKLKKAVGTIYSDDNGQTWRRGGIALRNGGEPNIAELPDGRVLLTARNTDPRNRRMAAHSQDGAAGWTKPEFIEDLLEPGCMAGIVSHPGTGSRTKPFLLFSNPDTTARAHKDRLNVTIKLSEDGGRTWPVSKVLQPGPSAYSDLAVLPDGTVLCFYESGDPETPRKNGRPWAYSFLTLARFNLDWLTSGNATPRPSRAENITRQNLRFEVVDSLSAPVIDSDHPDLAENKYGFEGGNVVKEDGVYHLFAAEMAGDPFWAKMRLAHWSSPDARQWRRISTLYATSGAMDTNDLRFSLWAPMPVYNKQEGRWNLFYVACRSWSSKPTEVVHMDGRIWRAASQAKGRSGIGGPYRDVGIVMQPDTESQPWEGQQGADSFYPWRVGRKWYAFYGSHNHFPQGPWLAGLAEAPVPSGPWRRCAGSNPSPIEKKFIENPIVTRIASEFVAIYDSSPDDSNPDCVTDGHNVGWSISSDGIHWAPGHRLDVQPGGSSWSEDVRTPLRLIPEEHAVCTMLYTGKATGRMFWPVGLVRLKLLTTN